LQKTMGPPEEDQYYTVFLSQLLASCATAGAFAALVSGCAIPICSVFTRTLLATTGPGLETCRVWIQLSGAVLSLTLPVTTAGNIGLD
jgi:hypothetical protein